MTIALVHPDTTRVVDAAVASRSHQDLALGRTMIPLGSCTMKLNAVSEMEAVFWPECAGIHRFTPNGRAARRRALIDDPDIVAGGFALPRHRRPQ